MWVVALVFFCVGQAASAHARTRHERGDQGWYATARHACFAQRVTPGVRRTTTPMGIEIIFSVISHPSSKALYGTDRVGNLRRSKLAVKTVRLPIAE